MCRRTLLAVVGALALAACGDNRDSTPTSPEFKPGGGTSCNYTSVKSYAKALFGSNSPGTQLAQDMSGNTAGSDAATAIAFDIFAAIAGKRDAAPGSFTAQNSSDGANLTVQTIQCANVVASGDKTFTAFNVALSTGGGYEVRGGTSDVDLTVVSSPVLSGIRPPQGQSFATWLDGRTLFYGHPITTFSTELSGGRAYDWAVVRKGSVLPALAPGLVAVCVESASPETDATLRVQHVSTILPQTSTLSLPCADPPVASLGPSSGTFVARMMGLLAPAPLHAASLVRTGSPTGGAGSFSPFEAVIPQSALLKFQNQPVDARKNQPIADKNGQAIQVKTTGKGGTACRE